MAFFATAAAVIGAGTSLFSAIRSGRNAQSNADTSARLADPFGSHREGWAQQLQTMWNSLSSMNPQEIMKDPQFQFLKEQGLGAINSNSASQGMYASGNRPQAAGRFATGLATQFLNSRWNQQQQLLGNLMGLSGATSGSPGTASTNYSLNQSAGQSGMWGGIGNALGMFSRINLPGSGGGGPNAAQGLQQPNNPWGT